MKNTNDPAGIYTSRMFRRDLHGADGPIPYAGTIALVSLWLLLMATYWIW